jgi:hypothetical protein
MKLVTQLLGTLAWPVVIAGFGIGLRRHIGTMVGNIADRFREVESASAAGVKITFSAQAEAAARALSIAGRSRPGTDIDRLVDADPFAKDPTGIHERGRRVWGALMDVRRRIDEAPEDELMTPSYDDLIGADRPTASTQAWLRLSDYTEVVRGLYGLDRLPEDPNDTTARIAALEHAQPGWHAVTETLRILNRMLSQEPEAGFSDADRLWFLELIATATDRIGDMLGFDAAAGRRLMELFKGGEPVLG